MAAVTVISFGYGHGEPPEAHLTVDVREHFRDPHVDPALWHLTAADEPVVQAVMSTPGVPTLIAGMLVVVQAFRRAPNPSPVTVGVGCVGGRHRSAVIAAELASKLRAAGVPVTLTHRDISRPVLDAARGPATTRPRIPGGFGQTLMMALHDAIEYAEAQPGQRGKSQAGLYRVLAREFGIGGLG